MRDPHRWLEPGSKPPPGARDVLRTLTEPPRMDTMVRARVAVRVAEHARSPEPARLFGPWWLAAAVVAGACVLVGTWLGSTDRTPDPRLASAPPIRFEPVPPAEKPEAAALAASAEAERAEAERAEAERAEAERVEEERAEEERAEEQQRRRERHRERQRRLAQSPPAAPGVVDIATVPWAEVTIDGRRVGNTPIRGHALAPGVHHIQFRTSDGTVSRIRVTVQSGQRLVLRRQLRSYSTRLDFEF